MIVLWYLQLIFFYLIVIYVFINVKHSQWFIQIIFHTGCLFFISWCKTKVNWVQSKQRSLCVCLSTHGKIIDAEQRSVPDLNHRYLNYYN